MKYYISYFRNLFASLSIRKGNYMYLFVPTFCSDLYMSEILVTRTAKGKDEGRNSSLFQAIGFRPF